MKKQVYLTNERIRYKFINNFDLANFAIHLAQKEINEEKQVTLSQIIDELAKMPDKIAKDKNQ